MVKKMVITVLSIENKAVFFRLKKMLKNSPNCFFDDCTLEYVSQHKHLGVLLSSIWGWSDHIVRKAYKKHGLLKKKGSRDILAQIYISFVRPQVELYAARIVTGILIRTSITFLYLETGWEPLVNRIDRSKLSTMYNIFYTILSLHILKK